MTKHALPQDWKEARRQRAFELKAQGWQQRAIARAFGVSDAAVSQWATDLMNGAPKPSNTVPGISYMARGGMHWEKDGKILMKEEPGAKLVKEPPHWMMMWPFDSSTTKLPNYPNPSGVWIMFDGTPYAHLMVYQDPNKMK
jgi:hypothetical protein